MTVSEEEYKFAFALAAGLLAKAVHRLQRVGLHRDAEEIIKEAKETIDLEIYVEDQTTKNN
jgi:hypothetical protein